MQIGFAILTHQLPDQARRLIRTLHRMFPQAPIVVHHDFSKCDFAADGLPPSAAFVRPHVETRWGKIGVFDGQLAALVQLAEALPPESWMVLLSGADYPIATASRILSDYASFSEDALLDYREISYQGYLTSGVPDGKFAYDSNAYQQVAYDRYMALRIPYPSWRKPWERKAAGAIFLRNPMLLRWFTPFRDGVRCFSGSQWFSIRAGALLRWRNSEGYAKWRRYFSKRHVPDEVVMQTGLLNDPQFKVARNNFRYIDWTNGGSHPKELGPEDVSKAWASVAHFARKFPHESPALEELDRRIFAG